MSNEELVACPGWVPGWSLVTALLAGYLVCAFVVRYQRSSSERGEAWRSLLVGAPRLVAVSWAVSRLLAQELPAALCTANTATRAGACLQLWGLAGTVVEAALSVGWLILAAHGTAPPKPWVTCSSTVLQVFSTVGQVAAEIARAESPTDTASTRLLWGLLGSFAAHGSLLILQEEEVTVFTPQLAILCLHWPLHLSVTWWLAPTALEAAGEDAQSLLPDLRQHAQRVGDFADASVFYFAFAHVLMCAQACFMAALPRVVAGLPSAASTLRSRPAFQSRRSSVAALGSVGDGARAAVPLSAAGRWRQQQTLRYSPAPDRVSLAPGPGAGGGQEQLQQDAAKNQQRSTAASQRAMCFAASPLSPAYELRAACGAPVIGPFGTPDTPVPGLPGGASGHNGVAVVGELQASSAAALLSTDAATPSRSRPQRRSTVSHFPNAPTGPAAEAQRVQDRRLQDSGGSQRPEESPAWRQRRTLASALSCCMLGVHAACLLYAARELHASVAWWRLALLALCLCALLAVCAAIAVHALVWPPLLVYVTGYAAFPSQLQFLVSQLGQGQPILAALLRAEAMLLVAWPALTGILLPAQLTQPYALHAYVVVALRAVTGCELLLHTLAYQLGAATLVRMAQTPLPVRGAHGVLVAWAQQQVDVLRVLPEHYLCAVLACVLRALMGKADAVNAQAEAGVERAATEPAAQASLHSVASAPYGTVRASQRSIHVPQADSAFGMLSAKSPRPNAAFGEGVEPATRRGGSAHSSAHPAQLLAGGASMSAGTSTIDGTTLPASGSATDLVQAGASTCSSALGTGVAIGLSSLSGELKGLASGVRSMLLSRHNSDINFAAPAPGAAGEGPGLGGSTHAALPVHMAALAAPPQATHMRASTASVVSEQIEALLDLRRVSTVFPVSGATASRMGSDALPSPQPPAGAPAAQHASMGMRRRRRRASNISVDNYYYTGSRLAGLDLRTHASASPSTMSDVEQDPNDTDGASRRRGRHRSPAWRALARTASITAGTLLQQTGSVPAPGSLGPAAAGSGGSGDKSGTVSPVSTGRGSLQRMASLPSRLRTTALVTSGDVTAAAEAEAAAGAAQAAGELDGGVVGPPDLDAAPAGMLAHRRRLAGSSRRVAGEPGPASAGAWTGAGAYVGGVAHVTGQYPGGGLGSSGGGAGWMGNAVPGRLGTTITAAALSAATAAAAAAAGTAPGMGCGPGEMDLRKEALRHMVMSRWRASMAAEAVAAETAAGDASAGFGGPFPGRHLGAAVQQSRRSLDDEHGHVISPVTTSTNNIMISRMTGTTGEDEVVAAIGAAAMGRPSNRQSVSGLGGPSQGHGVYRPTRSTVHGRAAPGQQSSVLLDAAEDEYVDVMADELDGFDLLETGYYTMPLDDLVFPAGAPAAGVAMPVLPRSTAAAAAAVAAVAAMAEDISVSSGQRAASSIPTSAIASLVGSQGVSGAATALTGNSRKSLGVSSRNTSIRTTYMSRNSSLNRNNTDYTAQQQTATNKRDLWTVVVGAWNLTLGCLRAWLSGGAAPRWAKPASGQVLAVLLHALALCGCLGLVTWAQLCVRALDAAVHLQALSLAACAAAAAPLVAAALHAAALLLVPDWCRRRSAPLWMARAALAPAVQLLALASLGLRPAWDLSRIVWSAAYFAAVVPLSAGHYGSLVLCSAAAVALAGPFSGMQQLTAAGGSAMGASLLALRQAAMLAGCGTAGAAAGLLVTRTAPSAVCSSLGRWCRRHLSPEVARRVEDVAAMAMGDAEDASPMPLLVLLVAQAPLRGLACWVWHRLAAVASEWLGMSAGTCDAAEASSGLWSAANSASFLAGAPVSPIPAAVLTSQLPRFARWLQPALLPAAQHMHGGVGGAGLMLGLLLLLAAAQTLLLRWLTGEGRATARQQQQQAGLMVLKAQLLAAPTVLELLQALTAGCEELLEGCSAWAVIVPSTEAEGGQQARPAEIHSLAGVLVELRAQHGELLPWPVAQRGGEQGVEPGRDREQGEHDEFEDDTAADVRGGSSKEDNDGEAGGGERSDGSRAQRGRGTPRCGSRSRRGRSRDSCTKSAASRQRQQQQQQQEGAAPTINLSEYPSIALALAHHAVWVVQGRVARAYSASPSLSDTVLLTQPTPPDLDGLCRGMGAAGLLVVPLECLAQPYGVLVVAAGTHGSLDRALRLLMLGMADALAQALYTKQLQAEVAASEMVMQDIYPSHAVQVLKRRFHAQGGAGAPASGSNASSMARLPVLSAQPSQAPNPLAVHTVGLGNAPSTPLPAGFMGQSAPPAMATAPGGPLEALVAPALGTRGSDDNGGGTPVITSAISGPPSYGSPTTRFGTVFTMRGASLDATGPSLFSTGPGSGGGSPGPHPSPLQVLQQAQADEASTAANSGSSNSAALASALGSAALLAASPHALGAAACGGAGSGSNNALRKLSGSGRFPQNSSNSGAGGMFSPAAAAVASALVPCMRGDSTRISPAGQSLLASVPLAAAGSQEAAGDAGSWGAGAAATSGRGGSGTHAGNAGGGGAVPTDVPYARWHSAVSVLFADICGYTATSQALEPEQVMALLHNLFCKYDALLSKYNVYKVETIGDCFMAATGLVHETPAHALDLVRFGRDMIRAAAEVTNPVTGEPLQIRVGINSGRVMSGIVGSCRARYCLFGDTVNSASRMESTGVPGRMQITEETYASLPEEERLGWECRGPVEVKGKGAMRTYLNVLEQ